MTERQLRQTLGAAVVTLGACGCDPNPQGPSAPSPSPPGAGKDSGPANGTPKSVPLKQVGPPIGLFALPPISP
ncbi:hypothetical protein SAMN05444166_7418 [Singulisphaera sp. GP187]|nr:hypothetical protein SAMN05444166_7418 [Singulisphaera sp. GP187]